MHPIQQQRSGSSGLVFMIVALILAAGGAYFLLGRESRDYAQAREQFDRDIEFRKFLTKAYGKRNEFQDQDRWNRWLVSEGHKPCITCNGAGRAGGASCHHCDGFGVEPIASK